MPTTAAPSLSPAAQLFADVFSDLTVAELNAVQRVYIGDYTEARDTGFAGHAGRILARINALGEYIDSRDGTARAAVSA